MKNVVFFLAAAFVLACAAPASANTYRHIYNESSCDLSFTVDAKAGNFYCNGGKNQFTVQANTSPQYETTTTSGISKGIIHISNINGSFYLRYLFTEGVMKYSGAGYVMEYISPGGEAGGTFEIPKCGKVNITVNSPAKGDIKVRNAGTSGGSQGTQVIPLTPSRPNTSAY